MILAAVPIVVEGRRCVVILEDVYDRVKSVFEVDPENAYPAILEAWDSVGSPASPADRR